MITLLYGQPGTGKSTLATGLALDYLQAGRHVAANFPIDAAPASNSRSGKLADAWVEVIPARPSFEALMALGVGWRAKEDYLREDRNGLLIIDEAGPWLNSRTWADKQRAEIIDWMLHSRKRGWDIVLIAQAPGLLDKQVREAVIEGYARCRRLDRLKIAGVHMPRVHIALCRYGLDPNAPLLERWVYRGTLEHKCFQSYALFSGENTDAGSYCTLPPRLTKWAGRLSPVEERLAQLRALVAARKRPPRPVPLKPKLPHVQAAMALAADRRIPVLAALSHSPS